MTSTFPSKYHAQFIEQITSTLACTQHQLQCIFILCVEEFSRFNETFQWKLVHYFPNAYTFTYYHTSIEHYKLVVHKIPHCIPRQQNIYGNISKLIVLFYNMYIILASLLIPHVFFTIGVICIITCACQVFFPQQFTLQHWTPTSSYNLLTILHHMVILLHHILIQTSSKIVSTITYFYTFTSHTFRNSAIFL